MVIDLFSLELVIQLPKLMAAQYTIPITGMVLGNCLRSNVIGINSFYYSLDEQQERYRFYLAGGASRDEAVFPFFRDALKKSANPTLASMATIGLVSLPGIMTYRVDTFFVVSLEHGKKRIYEIKRPTVSNNRQ